MLNCQEVGVLNEFKILSGLIHVKHRGLAGMTFGPRKIYKKETAWFELFE